MVVISTWCTEDKENKMKCKTKRSCAIFIDATVWYRRRCNFFKMPHDMNKSLPIFNINNICCLQRDQVQLQQKDIDSLREELEALKKSDIAKTKKITEEVEFWENQYKLLRHECINIGESNSELKKEIELWKGRCVDLEKKWQISESARLDATHAVKVVSYFTFVIIILITCIL